MNGATAPRRCDGRPTTREELDGNETMKRPDQHVTDDVGSSLMSLTLSELGWAVNPVDKDYGTDFDVEVFRDRRSTGVTFKVQLKSSRATPYSADGAFISQALDAPNARYLFEEMRVPVLLVHADVDARRLYWIALQLLPTEALGELREPERKSFTVRIPTANELPATATALLEAVVAAERHLASRTLLETPVEEFVATARRLEPAEIIAAMQLRADAVRLHEAERHVANHDVDAAEPSIAAVLSNTGSNPGVKFWAVLLDEKVRLHRTFLSYGGTARLAAIAAETSMRLRALARGWSRPHRFYSVIVRKAAELDELVFRLVGLSMNARANEDAVVKAVALANEREVYRRVVAKYRQCLRIVGLAAQSPYSPLLADAMLRIVRSLAAFIAQIEHSGFVDEAERFRASGLEICKLVVEIGRQADDAMLTGKGATCAFMLKPADTGPILDWIRATIASISDQETRSRVGGQLDELLRVRSGADQRLRVKATKRQAYENIAHGVGIDISSDQPLARFLRDAIEDAELDPTSVYARCEHLLTDFGPLHPAGQSMALTTACLKIVYCGRHGHAVRGPSLVRSLDTFERKYCDGCADRCARSQGWSYSAAWWNQERDRREKLLDAMFREDMQIVDAE